MNFKTEDKKVWATIIISIIIIILFSFNISILNFLNYFYYVFNKDKEHLAIDKSEISVLYENEEFSDDIFCQTSEEQYTLMKTKSDCIIDDNIEYIGFTVYLYNSYAKIHAVLNDEVVLEISKPSKENKFIWNDTYKINNYTVRGYLKNHELKDGLNKIVVSGNNKTDTLYIYKK